MNQYCYLLVAACCFTCQAEETIQVNNADEVIGAKGSMANTLGKKNFFIPYPYYSQVTSATAGVVLASQGIFQPQTTAFANFIYSSNDSRIAYFQIEDVQIYRRLFLEMKVLAGHWGDVDYYTDRTNDSSENDYIGISADDQWYRLNLDYLLPIGNGKKQIIDRYEIDGALLVPETASGGESWNPFVSGRSYLQLRPFYRKEDLKGIGEFATSGMGFGFYIDNRDWPINPSRGYTLQAEFKHDWGNLSDSVEWSAIEASFSKYVSLGASDFFQQRVLAFDVWTLDIPTWDETTVINGQTVFKRPPPFSGLSLGGWDRFRGYNANRFEDKAAIDYQVEYRVIPQWNPFPHIPLINRLKIPFWQWAVFAELGRVAPKWEIETLHSHMRWNAGVGMRAFVNGMLVRMDFATSEEGGQVQMIVDQPF
ncbi:BamA/TamA family outer membrane protein [uncultured Shewanella sp.]|uniref:BamA/TamA family outer membrane protein n=1 Tax=uncultured Shewanella sp. TaxID=173975 RepID=UPI00262CDA5B|nr:BamA/TamA family outer membrane protein [uncultured Shewanella sp.]